MREWKDLGVILAGVRLKESEDTVTWQLEGKKVFTSMHRFILNPGTMTCR
jgi:hypothetical protein